MEPLNPLTWISTLLKNLQFVMPAGGLHPPTEANHCFYLTYQDTPLRAIPTIQIALEHKLMVFYLEESDMARKPWEVALEIYYLVGSGI